MAGRAEPHQESSWPSRRRRAGRTKSQKLTITEAGFPGRPKTSPPGWTAKTSGLPGWMATRVEDRLAAELGEHPLDEVELAHGDAAAEEQHVRAEPLADEVAQRVHPVGGDAQGREAEAEGGARRQEEVGVGVAELAGGGDRLGRHHLVAGGQHGHGRSAVDGHLPVAVGGEEGQRPRGQAGAHGEQGTAGLQDLPPAAEVLARFPRVLEDHPLAAPPSVSRPGSRGRPPAVSGRRS